MPQTGWLGQDPDEAPAPQGMASTNFMLANRAAPGQGRTLQQALERAEHAPGRDDPEPEQDADDRAASLLTRGYAPGQLSQLSMRLADTEAALSAEREKLAKSAAFAEHLHRAHEGGRITGFGLMRALGGQDDEGDEATVGVLERRAQSLRQQIDEAHEASSPARPRQTDGIEAASRSAHKIFAETTRRMLAEAESGQPVSRPKDAGGVVAVRSEGPSTCPDCQDLGVTDLARERQIHEEMLVQQGKRERVQALEPFEVPVTVRRDMATYDGRAVEVYR